MCAFIALGKGRVRIKCVRVREVMEFFNDYEAAPHIIQTN